MLSAWLFLLISSLIASVAKNEDPKIDTDFIESLENREYSRFGSAPHFIGLHPVLKRKFFVKTHKNGEAESVKLELKALQMLRGTGYIPKGFGGIDYNNIFHLVMEHVNSFNLGKINDSAFRLKIYPHAVFYLSQILHALEMVNTAGLLYLDMKEENVLIDRDGLVVLADFGGCSSPEVVERNNYSRFCSPLYAAPEIIIQQDANTLRSCASEWWSFGVVCFLFFKGHLPFVAGKLTDLIDVVKFSLPETSDLTPDEITLVNGLLEKNIEKRLGFHSGLDRLKALAFFSEIDWKKVRTRELIAPLNFDEAIYTH